MQNPDDVERLNLPPDAKLGYLTQTTLSVDDAEVIIAALKKRFPQIVGPSRDDICYATQNRQEAVKLLAPKRTSCWCSEARTVRIACGLRKLRATAASPPT